MPEETYYCSDNFFKKMTDLESPRKNNDCYFYYYSTCAKGDTCTFRHEPSALGCETMCSFWKEGKCLNVHCNFRHMELRKNRKAIPCYWESQPGGCLKPHCSFLHQMPRPGEQDSPLGKTDSLKDKSNKCDDMLMDKLGDTNNIKNSAVDSLVVNFEEESDNESTHTFSPVKSSIPRKIKVKTLEEIKLEKIQEESAAYYSIQGNQMQDTGNDLRQRILNRLKTKQTSSTNEFTSSPDADMTAIKINKRPITEETSENDDSINPRKRFKLKPESNLSEIKIKTLQEIRNEKRKLELADSIRNEAEVSSTSMDDAPSTIEKSPVKKVKLRRNILPMQETVIKETPIEPKEDSEVNKTMDESLLLDEEEESISPISGKNDDDLLCEIDFYLNQ